MSKHTYNFQLLIWGEVEVFKKSMIKRMSFPVVATSCYLQINTIQNIALKWGFRTDVFSGGLREPTNIVICFWWQQFELETVKFWVTGCTWNYAFCCHALRLFNTMHNLHFLVARLTEFLLMSMVLCIHLIIWWCQFISFWRICSTYIFSYHDC